MCRPETTHRFLPMDDRARNNREQVRRARLAQKDSCLVAPDKSADRRSCRKTRYRSSPNERPGRSRASSRDRNRTRQFLQASLLQGCAARKFCHLRSTWIAGSPSIAPSSFSISSSSSPSAYAWAERRITLKTSRLAVGAFHGGRGLFPGPGRKYARHIFL